MAVYKNESLANLLSRGKLEPKSFLDLACKISEVLNILHEAQRVHQNLQPERIQIIGEPFGVKLIHDEREFQEYRRISSIPQVYYLAPEQTGRVLSKIDSRTDLYALGVIFYELLTGTRPFESDDYVDVIYYHLAREAVPIEQVDGQIPSILSDIVVKLMQKKMEDRYQTAKGLMADLEICRKTLEEREGTTTIPAFQLGRYDTAPELQFPQTVLGREPELTRMLNALEQVKRGQPRMIFVTGYSGVGKTTLVNKMHIPVQSSGGLFIHGKFDQFKKNIPYHSFIQAFDQLFQNILSQSKERIKSWKESVLQALEGNGKIITDIFPKLETLIGSQKPVDNLSANEAQYRFQRVFSQFFQAIVEDSAPLLLFLDDLQWADIHSLKLLEFIVTEKEEKLPLLMIGAYRDNEILAPHPLFALLERIRCLSSKQLEIVSLSNLSLIDVRENVMSILERRDEQAELFAQVCLTKTGGNPFFLNQFIQTLKDDGLISYSPEQGNWEVAIDQIPYQSVTDNVIDLMVKKIEKLPQTSIEILKWASCINNTFDLETLAKIQGLDEEVVLQAINESIKEGLVIAQETEPDGLLEVPRLEYRFLHDRVQQAANYLLTETTQQEICFRLGHWFLERNPEFMKSEKLLEITDYLNSAIERVTEKSDLQLLAQLNLESGKRAKHALASESALDYLQRGMALLGHEIWVHSYDLALEFYTEGTEIAYLCGDYVLVDQYGKEAIQKAKTLLDKAGIYIIKIESLTVQNRLAEAIETAREILNHLGINIPAKPSRLDVLRKYLEIRCALLGRNFEDLKNMTEMKDRTNLIIMRIITSAGIAAYTLSPPTLMMLTLNVVLMSLKHGIAPATAVAYSGYAHFLCTYMKKKELGYQFGKLAIELQDKMTSKAFACKTHLLFEILVRHQREPIRNTLLGFPKHHELGLNEGDLTSAGHVMMQYFVYQYLAGRKLSIIQKEMEEYKRVLLRTGNKTSIMVCLMYLQGHVNLLEAVHEPWQLTGEYFRESEALPLYREANDRTIMFNSYFNKMILSYLSRANQEALTCLDVLEEYFDGAIGTFCIPVYHFYSVLIRLEALESSSLVDKRLLQKRYRASLRELQRFLQAAPENIMNKYSLLRAELARIAGKTEQIFQYYDDSIRAAKENGFLPEEALAHELAARYALASGRWRLAARYGQEAINCYATWGWVKKAEELQQTYRDLLQNPETEGRRETAAASELLSYQQLDVETIVRASQALSEEIVLQELLKKMIWLVLQNSGARKAVLLLEKEGELYIEAEGNAEKEAVVVSQGESTRGKEQLPERILNYVVNSHESVILNTQKEIQQFIGEAWLAENKAKSLLCMPIESKRNLVGVIYLENDLIDGAFSEQHLSVLKILASQSSISIENARLYQNLEKKVDERTAQLKGKNLELQAINSQLEKAGQAKSEFLAKVSHEMRTPLQGILGMASLLKKGTLLPEQRELLKALADSANVLLELITEILDSSKVEAQRMELEMQDFDLKRLLSEILPPFIVKAEDKGLLLEVALDLSSLTCLRGDPLRIKQILSNLISNAVKFTEKGRVTVRVSVVNDRTTIAEEVPVTLEICVEDTGIGIPEDKLDYIFEDFTQVDSSITRKYGGTGLGLGITKKLLTLMKGSITVESCLGRGSVFLCRIPLFVSSINLGIDPVNKKNSQMRDIQDANKLTILVAEDDAISRKYLQAFLKYLGCNTTMVCNGLEVLEELQFREYDCVIMDKNMPELDGIEATRLIRRLEVVSGKHLPIIALTASALAGDQEKLLAEGVDYFLTKPVQEARLSELLRELKRHNSPGSFQESRFIERSVFLEEAALFGEDVLLDIVQQFLSEYESHMLFLEEAIEQEDYENLRKNAHRFASTLSIFQSSELVRLAQNLEQGATDRKQERLLECFIELQTKIKYFTIELTDIKKNLEFSVQQKNNAFEQ